MLWARPGAKRFTSRCQSPKQVRWSEIMMQIWRTSLSQDTQIPRGPANYHLRHHTGHPLPPLPPRPPRTSLCLGPSSSHRHNHRMEG